MPDAPEFIVETGKVAELRGALAIVELEPPAAPGMKPECVRCGQCAASRGERPELLASVPHGLTLAAGDRVEVRLKLASANKGGRTLLLGLPLAAFIGGIAAGWLIWKSEAAMAAAGFGAMAAAFLVLRLADRARGARADIARKL